MTGRAVQDCATGCASIAQAQKPEPNGRRGLSHAAPVRVLVAEDFVPYRRFTCSTLANLCGLQIVGEVSDGLEAIQKAVELRLDLIVLDIGLLCLNGIETARQIRKLVPDSKIIFLAQESSSDVVQVALSLGARVTL
jgi:DNA-binding NarL/FixJ family response regulator